MFVDLITLPNATSLISDISESSSPMFDTLLPIAKFVLGILIGAGLIVFLIKGVGGAVEKVIHRD